jgi:ABC-type sugar transport system substrate-binding protein
MLLAALALLLPMAAAHADKVEKRDPGMRWFTDLDEAIAEAKARNIPLFVAYHKDH